MSEPTSKFGGTPSRRAFLQGSLSAAALMAASRHYLVASAAHEPERVQRYGAFVELAPGVVRPAGWLQRYLQKQVDGLGSQLPKVSWPFTEAYWSGLEQGESWWPWEQKAYWVDGATRLALVTGDKALQEQVFAVLDYTLQHQQQNGYLGPHYFEDPKGDEHRWPQTVFFRGLTAIADAHAGPGGIPEAMRRHYLGDAADYALPERNVTNVESILWCYGQTGDRKLLALAEDAWSRYLLQVADEPNDGDLSVPRVEANTHIRAHGVTYAETSKLPAILYLYTGKQEYLDFAVKAQKRIFDHHMLVDGIPSTSEWYRSPNAIDAHETCCIVDHTWTWGFLLQATGDGIWADRIERACFNAGPGAIKDDWRALQYFSAPNQFIATMHSSQTIMGHGSPMMAYQPNPGRATACCGGNVHRLYPNFTSRAWMRRKGGGLAATFYSPSILKTYAGASDTPVEIEQDTEYPFSDTVMLRFNGSHEVEFPLSLRIPGWCKEPSIALNGHAVPAQPTQGFVTLTRRFRPGDTLLLHLPMSIALTHWPDGGAALERGPLVYSLPIRETWTSEIVPRYSTAEFPGWNAVPASAWNYGLVLDETSLEAQVKVERSPMSDEPWTNPPIRLVVAARRIEGYELEAHTNVKNQQFTPPLPDLGSDTQYQAIEQISLVPYGCTQLRATIFPLLNSRMQTAVGTA